MHEVVVKSFYNYMLFHSNSTSCYLRKKVYLLHFLVCKQFHLMKTFDWLSSCLIDFILTQQLKKTILYQEIDLSDNTSV